MEPVLLLLHHLTHVLVSNAAKAKSVKTELAYQLILVQVSSAVRTKCVRMEPVFVLIHVPA
jgi:hypothetical protein